MSLSSRAIGALCLSQALAMTAFGVAPLASQAAPGSATPVMRLASALDGESREVTVVRTASAVRMDREAFVLAYRRAARVACRIGLPNAIDGARTDARASLVTLGDGERADVAQALDSTYEGLQRAGGCAPLMNATKLMVVDGMEGFAWNSSLDKISKPSKGTYTDEGFFVLTRDAKMGGVKGEVTMTFTAVRGSEKLINGHYRFAVESGKCQEAWSAVEREIAARYPALRALGSTDVAPAACTDTNRWTTTFRNPDTDALEVSMVMRDGIDGQRYILVNLLGMPSALR